MKPPKEIKVGAFTYKTRFDLEACIAAGTTGFCLPDQSLLIITPANSSDAMRDTVLHEILHGVWNQTGLKIKYPDGDPDSPGEDIIFQLTPRLMALLRDNPEFVKFLMEGVA
jgi:hypothetical protein